MEDAAETGHAGERLGRFVATTACEALTPDLRHEGKRSILNFLGCALGVARDPAVETAVRVLQPLAGPAQAGLIGRLERFDPLSAAFVNAVAANLLDYDDTHLATVIHPAAPVAAPALALAEQRRLSGREVLTAFLLGVEVECRLGNAVSPGHYARGWHITATCGVFGAAAAAARLLGLSAGQAGHALGHAASQSAGLVENLATAAKNVGVGNAARNGLFAGLLAEQGWAAAPAAIEGPLGWARASGDSFDAAALCDGLGEHWEIARNSYKPYPCGIVMHAVIDACLELRSREELDAADIAAVTVRGDALLLARGDRAVNTDRDARVSIHHCAASALLWGRAGIGEFSNAAVFDPQAVALRGKVRAELDAAQPMGAAEVEIRTVSGATHRTTVVHARGSLENPLSDRELEDKLREQAAAGAASVDADRVIETVWRLDELDDAGDLMRLCAGA